MNSEPKWIALNLNNKVVYVEINDILDILVVNPQNNIYQVIFEDGTRWNVILEPKIVDYFMKEKGRK